MAVGWLASTPILHCAHALDLLGRQLCANGAVLKGYGNGLAVVNNAYNSSVWPYSNVTAGDAGSLNNVNSWLRFSLPGSPTHELIIQYTSTNGTFIHWRVKFSPSATFNQNQNNGTAGVPSANAPTSTKPPCATDEQIWAGSTSDATITGVQSGAADIRNCYLTGAAWDNTAPANYCFFFVIDGPSNTGPYFCFFRDRTLGGSVSDPEPFVYGIGTSNQYAMSEGSLAMEYNGYFVWGRLGATWQQIIPYAPAIGTTNIVQSSGQFAISKKTVGWPMYWGRSSNITTPQGHKGRSALWQWKGSATAYGVNLTQTSAGDARVVGDLLTPWGGV